MSKCETCRRWECTCDATSTCGQCERYRDVLEEIATANPEDLHTLDCIRLLAKIVNNARAALEGEER